MKNIDRIIQLKKKIENMKKYYDELDELVGELSHMKTGKVFNGTKGQIILIDNFEQKNTAYRTTSFKRFEVMVIKK